MKRVSLFVIILITSLAALIAATIIGFEIFASTQNPYNWMSQMIGSGGDTGGMAGMMGGTTTAPVTSSFLSYFGAIFAVLIMVTIIGIFGVAYYLIYPQIKVGVVGSIHTASNPTALNGNEASAYDSVAKTLTAEERKVVDVLSTHNGTYLQKYIKSETGLSRLKTHRIVARLSERGIVSLEKTGNTNQVYLANWLNQKG